LDQPVSAAPRYQRLIERTQWWGRQMLIYGVHTHVGVETVKKVLPITNALLCFVPHLQALSAASPVWHGVNTGYASNRAMMFQQLPTAGLPYQFDRWDQLESLTDDLVKTGVIETYSEIRWDVRPAPRFGTVEVRVCDAMPTLNEVLAVSALSLCLAEHFSTQLDRGGELPRLPQWFLRQNKWRAARYGLDAQVIINSSGDQQPVTDSLAHWLAVLEPVAARLGCTEQLTWVDGIVRHGASYQRQLKAGAMADGDLHTVVGALVSELATNRAA
jgi:carboxylate-amine ligase